MGLDTVELVMEFEDEFQISIPDAVAERITTVGQSFEFIVSELAKRYAGDAPGPCPTARKFRDVRRGLASEFSLPLRSIRPSALIDELIPAGPARAYWGRFAHEHGLPQPPFAIFPTRRFPPPKTTLAELVRNAKHANYQTARGDVDTERVWQVVQKIVSEQLGVELEEIVADARYIQDLNCD